MGTYRKLQLRLNLDHHPYRRISDAVTRFVENSWISISSLLRWALREYLPDAAFATAQRQPRPTGGSVRGQWTPLLELTAQSRTLPVASARSSADVGRKLRIYGP